MAAAKASMAISPPTFISLGSIGSPTRSRLLSLWIDILEMQKKERRIRTEGGLWQYLCYVLEGAVLAYCFGSTLGALHWGAGALA